MPRYPKIKFDELKMYFGKPYVIDVENSIGQVVVKIPTIGQIIDIGQDRFFQTLNLFITNTTVYRSFLWKLGQDWNEVSDFDLWKILYKNADDDVLNLLFEGIDFKQLDYYEQHKDEETRVLLYDPTNEVEINEEVYQNIHQYLQEVFNMHPEEEFTKDKTLKTWWIQKDEREASRKKDNDSNQKSLKTLISACINHPGFKYKLEELENVNVCVFYDSVKRLQIYESSTAVLKGLYSGMVDGSKIKPTEYDFMKEIEG